MGRKTRKNLSTDQIEKVRIALLDHLSRLLPNNSERQEFVEKMSSPIPITLRINPLSAQADRLRQVCNFNGSGVPWSQDVFLLDGNKDRIGTTFEHLLGGFYIQAKAATLAVSVLDPRPGEQVLDLAAAPGGKSTQIAGTMENKGVLLANEPNSRRMSSLIGNLERCGVYNCVVTQTSGAKLARYFHNHFDRVLLDAPCSGDGILRKNQHVLSYWSTADAVYKSQQQIGLARAAFHMLRPGGTMVYSTCSLSTEENEDVLLALSNTYQSCIEIIPVDQSVVGPPLPASVAANYPDSFRGAARVWPHHHDTEGAFVARIRKTEPTKWKAVDIANENCTKHIPTNTSSTTEPLDYLRRIEKHWNVEILLPDDITVTASPKNLDVRPQRWKNYAKLAFYIRCGLKIASIHKGHPYLTHQAAVLWGANIGMRRLPICWSDVQALFAGEKITPENVANLRGEVLLTYGPWPITTGLVHSTGHVSGFLPKSLRMSGICRLCDWENCAKNYQSP